MFFSLSNLGFPGTSNFVGELLVLTGLAKMNLLVTILASTGLILGAIYSM